MATDHHVGEHDENQAIDEEEVVKEEDAVALHEGLVAEDDEKDGLLKKSVNVEGAEREFVRPSFSRSCRTSRGAATLTVIIIATTFLFFFSSSFLKSKDDSALRGSNGSETSIKQLLTPPVGHREEGRVFYAGNITTRSSTTTQQQQQLLPRQDLHSSHPLMDPPVAVPDPYGWLRDETRSDVEVLQHLEAENNYTYHVTGSSPSFLQTKDRIFNRIKSMMKLDESSHTFPVRDRGFYYYRRTFPGKSYPVHCRAPVWDDEKVDNGSDRKKSSFNSHASYLKYHIEQWEEASSQSSNNGEDNYSSRPLLPDEVVYLDENELAKDHDFFSIGTIVISPSQKYVAYTVDVTGDEMYYIVVTNIVHQHARSDTGQKVHWEDPSTIVGEELLWGNDDEITLFYTKMDYTQRTDSVYRRRININADDDDEEEVLLFQEPDPLYWVGIGKTTDRRYLLVLIGSSESSEVRYFDLLFSSSEEGNNQMKVVAERRPNVLYDVDHRKGSWWMISTLGDDVSEYQLWISDGSDESNWKRVQDPSNQNLNMTAPPLLDNIIISDLKAFDRHVIVQGREDGMVRIWVIKFDDDGVDNDHEGNKISGSSIRSCTRLEWDINDPAYTVEVGGNMDFYSSTLIVEYESLITPRRYIDVDLHAEPTVSPNDDGEDFPRSVIMETKVPGYDRDLYICDRITVLARDGITHIPVSVVSRQDTMKKKITGSGAAAVPLHLYAYGAYGESMDDWFSTPRVALLDRGFVYAVAHVRGGGELGRAWYEDGKYLNKTHTFDDVVDVARYFVDEVKWTTPDLLSCEGRSAGGLTMGAAINQSPALFRAAILGVPFVDVVATMTDPSIPLTEPEWLEWGNPNEGYYFDTMMSYSPMQNVQSGVRYPSILLLAGLHDPRVQYWEPAKFAQELRYRQSSPTTSSGSTMVLLKTDMTSGHFSASDRYKNIESKSFEYAFIIWQLLLLTR